MNLQKKSFDAYTPAEDTFFFEDHIVHETGQSALEIGTGSGYLARILEKNFELVVATDIDYTSLKDARMGNAVCCDGASALGYKFDLIICNLPYLPSDGVDDRATDGGPEGLAVPMRIIASAVPCMKPGGRMLLLTSSLASYEKLIVELEMRGFSVKVLAKKNLFFEDLILLSATLPYDAKHD